MGTDSTILMFVNGQAMGGGALNDALSAAKFCGHVRTAPRYRFYSFDDEFPGISPDEVAGTSILGELYEVSYQVMCDDLLPREPEELELSVIELEDGRYSLSMVCRQPIPETAREITAEGGWREHLGLLTR